MNTATPLADSSDVAERGDLMPLGMASSHPQSVLGKAQRLLSAFDGAHPTLGLTDLSRRADLPKATVYRLAQQLVQLRLLERIGDSYQLGWHIFELGQLVPGPSGLRRVAAPVLMDLHAATKAVIHLAIPHQNETLYLERLAGRRHVRIHSTVGTRAPLWFTASGKLFIANGSDADRQLELLDSGAVRPRTRYSTRSSRELRPQIAKIRDQRWAEEREECLEGYKTYAVPIVVGGPNHVVAAVSATLDMNRRDDRSVTRSLWAAAADINRGLAR